MGEEFKAIRVLPFSNRTEDWDEWSEKFCNGIAAEKGFADVMLGVVKIPNADEVLAEDDQEKLHARKMNIKGYRELQLSTSDLSFTLVSLAKTTELPQGDCSLAWKNLKEEYALAEGEDKIDLLEAFQANKLEDPKINVTEWIASLLQQRVKLSQLGHVIDDEYLKIHILASLPKEYDALVDQAKIDSRSGSLTMKELKTRLKEKFTVMKRQHGWTDDEVVMLAQTKQAKAAKKPKKRFKGKCRHCGKVGHKKAECREFLASRQEEQEQKSGSSTAGKQDGTGTGTGSRKDLSKIKCYNCNQYGHYANKCPEKQQGSTEENTFAMMGFEEGNGSDEEQRVMCDEAVRVQEGTSVISSPTSLQKIMDHYEKVDHDSPEDLNHAQVEEINLNYYLEREKNSSEYDGNFRKREKNLSEGEKNRSEEKNISSNANPNASHFYETHDRSENSNSENYKEEHQEEEKGEATFNCVFNLEESGLPYQVNMAIKVSSTKSSSQTHEQPTGKQKEQEPGQVNPRKLKPSNLDVQEAQSGKSSSKDKMEESDEEDGKPPDKKLKPTTMEVAITHDVMESDGKVNVLAVQGKARNAMQRMEELEALMADQRLVLSGCQEYWDKYVDKDECGPMLGPMRKVRLGDLKEDPKRAARCGKFVLEKLNLSPQEEMVQTAMSKTPGSAKEE